MSWTIMKWVKISNMSFLRNVRKIYVKYANFVGKYLKTFVIYRQDSSNPLLLRYDIP